MKVNLKLFKTHLKILILLVIMLLAFATTPIITSAAFTNPKTDPKLIDIAEKVTERYLHSWGFVSLNKVALTVSQPNDDLVNRASQYTATNNRNEKVTISENSMFTFENSNSIVQYTYNSTFNMSNGTTYRVSEFCTKETTESKITTIAGQTTEGPTDFEIVAKETKNIGDTVTKQNSLCLAFSNSTGTYHSISNSSLTFDRLGTTLITGTGLMNQNIFGKPGQYSMEFKPEVNGLGIKAMLTEPDGNVIDPGIYSDSMWDSYGNYLSIDYFYYTPAESNWIGLAEALLGLLTIAIAPPTAVALFIAAITTNIAIGEFYESSVNGGLFIMYDLGIAWLGVIPVMDENGFLSDLFNGEPITYYEEFWFIATNNSCLWQIGELFKHSSPWPNYYI